MRNFKKILSLVLCMAMMLSVMVVGAGAAFKDQSKIVNEDAVDFCSALGIINGYEDGSFRPEGTITRAEMTKMMAIAMNGKEPPVVDNGKSSFVDVLTSNNSKWANKYIEFCYAAKVVAGIGANKYNPDGNVTATEAAKMLLVILGNDPVANGYLGAGWDLRVNVDAAKAGLFKGLNDIDLSAALTRDDAAQMIWNALNAKLVDDEGNTLLNDKFDAKVVSGINKGTSKYNFDTKEYTYKIGAKKLVSTENYADLYAMSVDALVRDGKIIGMIVAKGGVVFEGSVGDLLAEEDNLNLDNNAVDAEKDMKAGQFNQYDTLKKLARYENKELCYYGVRAIDQDGGGDIDYIVVYPYSVLKVTDVDTDQVTVRALANKDGKCVAENADYYNMGGVYATKASVAQAGSKPYAQVIGDLERYGYAIGVRAENTLEGLNTLIDLDAKTGKISSLDSADYNVTFAGDATYSADQLGIDVFACLSVKYEYTYVAVNGHLFLVNGAGVQAQAQYAVVTANSANTTGTTAKVWQTELLLPDGTTKTVESNQKRVVGRMFTYDIDNNGVYVMNPVKNASLVTDDCIYDIQDVFDNTLNKDNNDAGLIVAEDKVGVYVGGSKAGLSTDTAGNKYYVTNDTVVYAYYTADDSYAVISAADLKDNLGNVTGAAVAAANKASNGFYEAQIIYVAMPHDVNEVVETIYINGETARVEADENGDFYVIVDAMLPGGELKEIESKHVDLKEDADLLKDLYNNTYVDGVYEVRMLDGKIVHVAEEVDLTEVVVTATYDGKGAFTADGMTYVVTDDTLIFSLDGKSLDAITEGDTVRVLVGDVEDGTAELDILVYAD